MQFFEQLAVGILDSLHRFGKNFNATDSEIQTYFITAKMVLDLNETYRPSRNNLKSLLLK